MDSDQLSKEAVSAVLANGSFLQFVSELTFEQSREVGSVVAQVSDTGHHDVIADLGKLVWADLDRRVQILLGYVVQGFISATGESAPRVIPFAELMMTRAVDFGAYGLQQAVDRWLEGGEGRCKDAYGILNLRSESTLLGLVLEKWRVHAPANAIQAVLDLNVSRSGQHSKVATMALGGYGNTPDDVRARAIDALVSKLSGSDQAARTNAIYPAARFISEGIGSPELVDALETIAKDPLPDDRDQLITSFVQNRYSYPDRLRTWTFELMKEASTENPAVLGLVDSALYDLDIQKERRLIADIVAAIVDREVKPASLVSFQSTVYKIREAGSGIRGWFLAHWLLCGEYQLRFEVHSLFEPLDRSVYEFSIADFKLSDQEILFLGRKIFGFMFFSNGPAVSLLYACLAALHGQTQRELEVGIFSFWLANFPGDMGLFDELVRLYPHSGMKASVARIRKLHRIREAEITALPANPALQPSTSERRVQAELTFEQQAEIHRSAEKGSIFASMMHKSTILYGRSSVSYMHGPDGSEPIRQVLPLAKYEMSTPIPRMDVLQPVLVDSMLRMFRMEEHP